MLQSRGCTGLHEVVDDEHVAASGVALLDGDDPFVALPSHLGAEDGVELAELTAESFDRSLVRERNRYVLEHAWVTPATNTTTHTTLRDVA